MERRITIDNRDLHLSEDGFCKEVLRQIADAFAENPQDQIIQGCLRGKILG